MRILLIQQEEDAREKLVFSIESSYDVFVLEAGHPAEARKLLASTKAGFDLVICDQHACTADEMGRLIPKGSKTPVILCVDDLHASRRPKVHFMLAGIVARSSLISGVFKILDELLAKDASALAAEDAKELARKFCKIRTRLLLSVAPLKGDIYIRLSEIKFVKLFREGDVFDQADLEKYTHRKGIEYLYIRKEQSPEFIEKYRFDLEKRLQNDPPPSITELSVISAGVFETVQELGRTVGFTREVQAIVQTQVRATLRTMGRSPRLSEILARIQQLGGEYLSTHSTLTGYVACAIASRMEWGSELTFAKLTLAAMLHDIVLESNELAACENLEQLEKGEFTKQEKLDFKAHPSKAAEIARQFHEVPPDVDLIVFQHHEWPDGSGFPRGIVPPHISPLSTVFIVAHQVADEVLKQGKQGKAFDIPEFIERNKELYKSSGFRKALMALETASI